MSLQPHAVDEMFPPPRLLTLGLQHVLVMYAGAVAVPLIVGHALKLMPEEVAFLISADLLACGLATLVQCIGFPGVGIRLPVMMGVTFASVGPMISIGIGAGGGTNGLLSVYGAIIAAAIFAILVAPFISRLLPLFPPVVTGTIILVIGVSLMRVAINWAAGGQPTIMKMVDGVQGQFPNPAYGGLQGLGVALFVLVVVLSLIRWGTGFVANISVLLGIVAGTIVSAIIGLMHFDKVASASWFAFVIPFHFGVPHFAPIPAATMCIVMIVVMIESLGMFLALGEMTGKPIDKDALTQGLRADGVGSLLGGIFNTFPYTSFSQNVGLVGITGVKSRWVTVAGGSIMIVLGLLPKMSAFVEAIPQVVLGGAGIVMFGMVAATGARILTAVDFKTNRFNLYIVAISVGFGMISLVSPTFFKNLPLTLHPLLESGILMAAVVSVVLNVFFNGVGDAESAQAEAAAVAASAEHV